MDRNREARRTSMAAAPNGLSRRRHRSSSLRDSPDEDGPVELQEQTRLRDRGGLKKDRDRDRDRERERERERERDRDRERERSSRSSKRRRENRIMNREDGGGGEDTSEESVNDEDEDDEDVDGGLRMLPPQPTNPTSSTNMSNNHHHQQNRKSFPPSAAKVFRTPAAAVAPSGWKAADEMIGVSVPRKARSASTKRSHDWISGGGGGSGGVGAEQIHRQPSTSPVRLTSAASPASPANAPVSPSSSNVSIRKKMKPNGGAKPRPPKSSSKSSSSNPEELEIEIAEVLYGLMTQSQAPSKKEIVSNDSNKFDSNKSSSDNKSRVSSPISNSTAPLPQNSSSSALPLSAVAPKRKRPRQVPETIGNFSVRSSPGSSMKTEIDHQSPKTEVSSPNLDNNSGSAAENAVSFDFANLSKEPPRPVELTEEDGKCGDVALTKEEVTSPKKESTAVRLDGNILEAMIATAPSTATKPSAAVSEIESQRAEKFEIDLMAPPPQLRSSPERDGEIDIADHKLMASCVDAEMRQMIKDKEDEKLGKAGKEEAVAEEKRSKAIVEEVEESKKKVVKEERNIDLQLDLEKADKDCISMVSGSSNRSQHQVLRHQQPTSVKATRDEINMEKTAQPNYLALPMSVASSPGGLPPMGYMAPLQGVVSMDGNTVPSTPIQPIFTQPRLKRCATHCYIARNISYLQQFMKLNTFWPAAAGSAPMFGAKPCNLNVMHSAELHGSIAGRSLNSVQDKGQGIAVFPGHTGKDKSLQATSIPDPAQRKQQILLQQAMPPVTPNNILHGPAFIFPFNNQQAAVAAASSVRPGPSKSTTTTGSLAASSATNAATVSASATSAAAMSFNYPNMSANEAQYLAILPNNAYPFPIPAVGAPPNYRGNPHAQPMPLFNGSFYSSQMFHPSQLQQQQQQPPPPSSQSQQSSQAHQNSSGNSSSSHKHLQIQQHRQQQGSAVNGGGGSGNLHNYPAPKNRSSQQSQQQQNQHINPPQARHLENEVAGEDSPSTADSRVSSRAPTMSVYGHNFAMPIHPQNFALMTSPALSNNASGNSNEKKQQHQQQQSQQQGLKRGVESFPQTFAMSFSPINGSNTTGIDISTMAQFQNHSDSRQSHHQLMAAAAAVGYAQPKKNFRISEESKTGGGPESSNVDEDRKVVGGLAGKGGGQSIAFSRPDLTDASGSSSAISGNSVIDSSSRNLNLASGSPARTSRSPMSNSVGASNAHLQNQLHQQQQVMQLHKHQQQNQHLAASLASRSKNQPTSNGSAYPEHLMTSSSSVAAKFPNSLSSFPQSLVQTSNSSSPTQSPQWKNSARTTPSNSQVPSSLASSSNTSSLKNLPPPQQQTSRTHQQSHTQISFGANPNQKSSTSQVVQQQAPNSNNSRCHSPPMAVGSPTSSISKGASGSPRTNASASTSNKTGQASSLSSQQSKNTPAAPSQRSSPSILGNPTTKSQQQQKQQQQQQLSKQSLPQAQLYFSNPYIQVQHSGNSTASAATSGYYLQNLQRRRPEQQSQLSQQQSLGGSSATSSSTGMLSLCPPVTLASASTTDPTKAIAAAVVKGGGGLASQQGILHAQFAAQSSGNAHQLLPAGFPYVHTVPAAVQVKTAEQKQPAGNDNLHACWQPEKK